MTWTQVEPILREKAYRTIDNDPQVLLEHDAGGIPVEADAIFARLLGWDDQIIEDGIRLRRAEPVLLLPRLRPVRFDPTAAPDNAIPQPATYVLQSGFATAEVAPEHQPPGLSYAGHRFRVLYVRYRIRR